ncbi:HAAAP family serine/threonine permease [Vibrio cincinnatiensis]|uniref:aromatic amino acid transport family protein n=1 Tax=Vibrio cincinnatiensis TaxID=675 RepID=UPI001EE05D91|nr:HAAAP family serine/threonine permease [Vibrio cincinnatiensis]MCG3731171.1 HAAAP family serine/threonine permease [Vibrio cincinnatiensis]MCG3736362.1 HAAAP family serine/threonine permease [Vibrio cincinnatiensis]MCG3738684.1 HAAAP family serine/threonine permease [Vibrio cincinnatiensis]MCG3742463.1 HAAAP family serine/threonine permease [Vibrio cincinnatiensis]
MKESINVLNYSTTNNSSTWNTHDTYWTLSLFGTAVGAGILFLPINLGLGGFWPLIILATLAYPMTYFSHRGLARFVLSSQQSQGDFTDVIQEHFGVKAGRTISWLYFLSIFPILLIYGVGLTNTVESFLIHQAAVTPPPRTLLSGLLVLVLFSIMLGGEKIMLRTFAVMVYPLAAILLILSLYLIPRWHMPSLDLPKLTEFTQTIWLAIPVVVFSFSHAAAISSFAHVQRRHYQKQAGVKSEQILRRTSLLLIAFVLLFVFSCIFTLSPEQLVEAKEQNISILSYLANVTQNPLMGTLGPFVAFIAITSSFLGHFLGARESLNGLITKHTSLSYSTADKVGILFLFLTIWITAILNPSILGLMEALSGPVIALILFIMPMIAVYKVSLLHTYKKNISTYFIFASGVLAVSALLFRLLN